MNLCEYVCFIRRRCNCHCGGTRRLQFHSEYYTFMIDIVSCRWKTSKVLSPKSVRIAIGRTPSLIWHEALILMYSCTYSSALPGGVAATSDSFLFSCHCKRWFTLLTYQKKKKKVQSALYFLPSFSLPLRNIIRIRNLLNEMLFFFF